MKILTIDDSKAMRATIAQMVADLGHECLQAADGLEGLVVLLRTPDVDLVLLDREMPKLDGIGFLHQLARREDAPHPAVIMVSSRNEPEYALEALEAGASDFLGKPFDAATLRAHIESALARR